MEIRQTRLYLRDKTVEVDRTDWTLEIRKK